MTDVRILAPAELEMIEAATYYEAHALGLGNDFLDEIETAVNRIRDFPEAASPLDFNIRRQLISRFPYALLYRIDPAEIVILAVMHFKRRPNYWISRT